MGFFDSAHGKEHTQEAATKRKQQFQEAKRQRALERVRLDKEIVASGRSGRVSDLIQRLGGSSPGTNHETFCRFCNQEKDDVLMGVCPDCVRPLDPEAVPHNTRPQTVAQRTARKWLVDV